MLGGVMWAVRVERSLGDLWDLRREGQAFPQKGSSGRKAATGALWVLVSFDENHRHNEQVKLDDL